MQPKQSIIHYNSFHVVVMILLCQSYTHAFNQSVALYVILSCGLLVFLISQASYDHWSGFNMFVCVYMCVVPVKSSNIVSQCVLLISSWAVVVIHSFRKNFSGFILKVRHTHTLPRHCWPLKHPATEMTLCLSLCSAAVISKAAAIINLLEGFNRFIWSMGKTLLSLHKINTTCLYKPRTIPEVCEHCGYWLIDWNLYLECIHFCWFVFDLKKTNTNK